MGKAKGPAGKLAAIIRKDQKSVGGNPSGSGQATTDANAAALRKRREGGK